MSRRHVRIDVEQKGLNHALAHTALSKGGLIAKTLPVQIEAEIETVKVLENGFKELPEVKKSLEQPITPVLSVPPRPAQKEKPVVQQEPTKSTHVTVEKKHKRIKESEVRVDVSTKIDGL